MKAEVAAAVQASAMRFEFTNFSQSHNDVMFSLDDFEGNFATGMTAALCLHCLLLSFDGSSLLVVDILILQFLFASGCNPIFLSALSRISVYFLSALNPHLFALKL